MAFFHSPTLPKENLQILMDFANPACYPGSGTTINNLAVPGRNLGYIKNSVTTLTNKGFNVLRPNGGGAGLNAVGDRIDINTSADTISMNGIIGGNFNYDNSYYSTYYCLTPCVMVVFLRHPVSSRKLHNFR